jgi:hypothetical protein
MYIFTCRYLIFAKTTAKELQENLYGMYIRIYSCSCICMYKLGLGLEEALEGLHVCMIFLFIYTAGEGPSSKLRSSGSRKATRLDEFAGAVEDVEEKRRRLDDMQRQATSKVI